MLEIFNGDCLMIMEGLPENSIDVIFCDLPYGQTSCKWDCKIDLKLFWENIMRIKKINTPIFMTTTTKFGVDLIQSCPKNCPFRYDLVWVKSSPAGFLCAKKMPMRKHEMVYVFYEKLPFYDLSSHKHKFLKDKEVIRTDEGCNGLYGKEEKKVFIYDENGKLRNSEPRYDPPLPVSIVKEEYDTNKGSTMINGTLGGAYDSRWQKGHQGNSYDPPLPVSVVKEEIKDGAVNENYEGLYGGLKAPDYVSNNIERNKLRRKYKKEGKSESAYDPPLPVSVVKEGEMVKDFTDNKNGNIYDCPDNQEFKGRNGQPRYDPPLPVSVVTVGASSKEDVYDATERFKNGKLTKNPRHLQKGDEPIYDPPLPVSVVKEEYIQPDTYGKNSNKEYNSEFANKKGYNKNQVLYDPPLPTTMLEIKSTRGKHSTEKPVALMEWIFKYYSKKGDVVLDPTMGSGSTGVACQNMGLDFIGIEMDPEIFQVAKERLKL